MGECEDEGNLRRTGPYVTDPRKQLNQDFGTNMLLKPKLGINFKLTMAPDIPQCTLKMISIQPGLHFMSMM